MEKFNQIIFDIFKLPASEIKDSLTAKDLPGWDSMNYLLFIAELEKEFNVTFSMDEVLTAGSLGTVKAMLQAKGVKL
jgi:acyl carrier protein